MVQRLFQNTLRYRNKFIKLIYRDGKKITDIAKTPWGAILGAGEAELYLQAWQNKISRDVVAKQIFFDTNQQNLHILYDALNSCTFLAWNVLLAPVLLKLYFYSAALLQLFLLRFFVKRSCSFTVETHTVRQLESVHFKGRLFKNKNTCSAFLLGDKEKFLAEYAKNDIYQNAYLTKYTFWPLQNCMFSYTRKMTQHANMRVCLYLQNYILKKCSFNKYTYLISREPEFANFTKYSSGWNVHLLNAQNIGCKNACLTKKNIVNKK